MFRLLVLGRGPGKLNGRVKALVPRCGAVLTSITVKSKYTLLLVVQGCNCAVAGSGPNRNPNPNANAPTILTLLKALVRPAGAWHLMAKNVVRFLLISHSSRKAPEFSRQPQPARIGPVAGADSRFRPTIAKPASAHNQLADPSGREIITN